MNENRNLVELNIELSAEFSRYLFDHPEFSDRIPPDSEIILVPEFDADMNNTFFIGVYPGIDDKQLDHIQAVFDLFMAGERVS